MLISTTDRKLIAQAIKKSAESNYKHKHGALIYRGGSVMACAANRSRNSARHVDRGEATWHAEHAAIKSSGATDGATIYVGRVTKGGAFAESKPCEKCLRLIFMAGIKRVVYTVDGGIESARIKTEEL